MLVLLFILNIVWADECKNQYDLACCKEDCPFCGLCKANGTYDEFEDNCCADIILSTKLYCNQTDPPCILQIKINNIDRIINFFKKEKLYIVIPVSVALGLIILFILYSGFIFGSKTPPLKYKYMIGRLQDLK